MTSVLPLRQITALAFLISGLLGGIIYQVKHRVLTLEQTMQALNHRIIRLNEDIHVLKAEWEYLNHPKRLQALNQRYLQLKPIGHTQVASYRTFPTLVASRNSKSTNRVLIAQRTQKGIVT